MVRGGSAFTGGVPTGAGAAPWPGGKAFTAPHCPQNWAWGGRGLPHWMQDRVVIAARPSSYAQALAREKPAYAARSGLRARGAAAVALAESTEIERGSRNVETTAKSPVRCSIFPSKLAHRLVFRTRRRAYLRPRKRFERQLRGCRGRRGA